uniref:Uncharacterized protein n=1 Tax=Physcomitrium patens TaxID=3218 RepID=A0A2K1K492_PHYPA|nr:hypothetical protein PHYPA_013078 [Physcomitrium patens]
MKLVFLILSIATTSFFLQTARYIVYDVFCWLMVVTFAIISLDRHISYSNGRETSLGAEGGSKYFSCDTPSNCAFDNLHVSFKIADLLDRNNVFP